MNKKRFIGLAILCCAWSIAANALDESGQRYIDRLAKGGPESLHDVAESLYQTRTTDTEVLDVAAEVLLQKYNAASGSFGYTDAMAWLCKALGASGNARYKAALSEVGNKAESRKLRSHCEKALKELPKKSDAAQYAAGTIDLQKLREPPPPVAAAPEKPANGKKTTNAKSAAATPAPAAAPQGKTVNFSLVKEGMSAQEVEDLIGAPTNTSQYMTGKQFNPFNYGARDLQRMKFLYKGVGHITFSLKSAYNGVFRVIEVVPDSNESGYP